MSELKVACRIGALSAEERALHAGQLRQLQAAVREVEELPNGYAFRLDASARRRLAAYLRAIGCGSSIG